MAPLPTFTWANGGVALTPQDAARKRAIAAALIQQNNAPAKNWAEGLSQLAGGYVSGVLNDRAGEAETAGQDSVARALAGLSSSSPQSDIVSAAVNPWITPGQQDTAQQLLGGQLTEQAKAIGAGDWYFGTTLPYETPGPDGKPVLHYYQLQKGKGLPDLPDGGRWLEPTSTVNTGTNQTIIGRNTGDVQGAIPIDNTGAELDKGIGSGLATGVLKSKDDAEGAGKLLNILSEGENLLNQGAYTGAGAKGKVALTNWAQTLGIDVPADAATNSQAFQGVMGQAVGQIIKQFGSGTGLSDADRQYAQQIAGGDIELTEPAIRKLIGIAKKNAQATIDSYKRTSQAVQSGNVGQMLQVQNGPQATQPANLPNPADVDAIVNQVLNGNP